jgi:hypothetical protein
MQSVDCAVAFTAPLERPLLLFTHETSTPALVLLAGKVASSVLSAPLASHQT